MREAATFVLSLALLVTPSAAGAVIQGGNPSERTARPPVVANPEAKGPSSLSNLGAPLGPGDAATAAGQGEAVRQAVAPMAEAAEAAAEGDGHALEAGYDGTGSQPRLVDANVVVVKDAESVATQAAEWLDAWVAAAPRERPFSVMLPGGATPRPFFRRLAETGSRFPWDRMHFFWSDERMVPPDDEHSNFGQANRLLLSRVPVPQANVHRIEGELKDPVAAAARYEAALRTFFAGQTWPRLDAVFLGVGPDGHTASLFPGSAALGEAGRWAAENYAPSIGAWRVTLTAPALNAAASAVFMVTGAGKADVARRLLRSQEALPARLIAPRSGQLRWLLDRAAASQLFPSSSTQ